MIIKIGSSLLEGYKTRPVQEVKYWNILYFVPRDDAYLLSWGVHNIERTNTREITYIIHYTFSEKRHVFAKLPLNPFSKPSLHKIILAHGQLFCMSQRIKYEKENTTKLKVHFPILICFQLMSMAQTRQYQTTRQYHQTIRQYHQTIRQYHQTIRQHHQAT